MPKLLGTAGNLEVRPNPTISLRQFQHFHPALPGREVTTSGQGRDLRSPESGGMPYRAPWLRSARAGHPTVQRPAKSSASSRGAVTSQMGRNRRRTRLVQQASLRGCAALPKSRSLRRDAKRPPRDVRDERIARRIGSTSRAAGILHSRSLCVGAVATTDPERETWD